MASSKKRRRADPVVEQLRDRVGGLFRSNPAAPGGMTVALSGGIDSVVLLDLCRSAASSLGFRLSALHVNHGLSPNADKWEAFCRLHCRRRRIPFQAAKVSVPGAGANVEAQARIARYDAFARLGGNIVVLGHNRDDQAETVLLQLIRGAGIRGLSAMPVVRTIERHAPAHCGEGSATGVLILRPLLEVSRDEITRYAARRRLHWIEDESNAESRFARNFLRTRILPSLEHRFPGCRAALARSSAHMASASGLLDDLARLDALSAVRAEKLRIESLLALGPARAANLMRFFLRQRGLPAPPAKHLSAMLAQLSSERSDAVPQLQLGPVSVRRFKGWIELVPVQTVDRQAQPLRWTGQSRLALPQGGALHARSTRGRGVSAARLSGGVVTIRPRRGGERIRLDAARPQRTLKNLLQEAGVPPWRRERMPLLYSGEQLVWVPGLGVASSFQAHGRERALLFSWVDVGQGSEP